MQNGLTLPKQNWQQPLLTFSSTCAHPTTLRKKGIFDMFHENWDNAGEWGTG